MLEHGVFLGDSKHRAANTFEQFLAEHSGHSNAFTSQENTNYYYKISADKLEESLDRLSSLLSDPLLELESLQREYHAIQSEFLKDTLESARQIWRLVKHLANPDHPFHRLSPGNLETLQNLKNSSVIKDFHSKHYFPENMKCVVYGRQDTQYLLQISRKHFGRITNKKSRFEADSQPGVVQAYPPQNLGLWVNYKLLREGNDLDIIWPVVGGSRCGLGSAVHVLSERHPRSVLALLKRQGLATSVTWSIVISTSSFSLVRVNVKLTELGGQKIVMVAKLIFSQVEALKAESLTTMKSWLTKAHQESMQHFINHENPEVHHFVKSLSSRMSRVLHPAYYLGAPIQTPTVTCLVQALLSLTSHKSIMLFGSSDEEQLYRNAEPWYGIPYTATVLSDRDLDSVQNSLNNNFEIWPPPAQRARISKTFPLFERDLEQDYWPTKIQNDRGLTVWWQQDYTFHIPKIDMVLWIYGRYEHSTPREIALHYILAEMIRDQLEDLIKPPGYSMQIYYQSSSGLIVTLAGYSDHEQISRCIKDLVSVLTGLDTTQKNRFIYVVKYKAHRDLVRSDYAEAYKHPLYKSRVLLEKNVAPLEKIISEIDSVTLESFKVFYKSFWESVGCRALIYGNVLKTMAQQYGHMFKPISMRTLNSGHKVDPPFHPTLQYPPGTYYTITRYPNSKETASVADLTIILGPTPWNSDTIESGEDLFTRTILGRVTASLLSEPAFIELRTRQQLGYSVFTKYISHFGVDYIHICVQGSEHSAVEIANSVLRFLESYRKDLMSIMNTKAETSTATHWTRVIDSVRRDILVKPPTQRAMANEIASELFSPDSEPDRADMLVASLDRATPQMLLKFYDEYVLGSKSRRIMSLAQSENRIWALDKFVEQFQLLDFHNKSESISPFLYWHFTYLGLEMGK